MRHSSFSVLSMGIVLLSCGCGSIIPQPGPAPHHYILEKVGDNNGAAHPTSKHSSKQLMIDLPSVYGPLDNQRVAIMASSYELNNFANIEWAERLPVLIQESLIYSLQDAHLYGGVSRSADGLIPDHLLKVDVRKFYIEQRNGAKLSATVECFVNLVNPLSHHTSAEQIFSASVPLNGVVLEEGETAPKELIIQALNTANKQVLMQIIQWLRKYS